MIGPFVLKNEISCDDYLKRDKPKQIIEEAMFYFHL